MTDSIRTVSPAYKEPVGVSPTYRDPVSVSPTYRDPVAVAPRMAMTTTGPIFSGADMVAGVAAAVMLLGPLAMAAFAVGRY